ncbi:MAG: UTP--glucose-1-phosphate uridylyltransferase, partial [Verrucomicrobiota bacterium]
MPDATMETVETRIAAKMRAAGVSEATVAGFLDAVRRVQAGQRGLLAEADLDPVASLPRLESLPEAGDGAAERLAGLVVIKLNGGLGTGMGLDRAKSLVPVRGGDTFLDFIVRQVLHLRARTGGNVPAFTLMNSAVTRPDTLEHLRSFPGLGGEGALDFLQSMVPKLVAGTLEPVAWPADPGLEWCPPGHGDFYPSLWSSGLLDRFLARGIRYAFVSNSDNLGATVDERILRQFAEGGLPFLMEVADRTAADRKGGHLARSRSTGRLLLRESAQCPGADEAAFQDVERHRFFNTNNLWIRLDRVREELDRRGGVFPLPLIVNRKTVDPRDARSPAVLQLESAMGAAIECFAGSAALVVPRTRFAPVKATADLLALRSDAYQVAGGERLELVPGRGGQPPLVDLDGAHYKVLADFERFFPAGVPSLARCEALTVRGPVV